MEERFICTPRSSKLEKAFAPPMTRAVRRTSALFSYDWECGVALAAAIMGLGGLFATGPGSLALLLATAASSAWLTTSRTGFLGKTLAYPGCILLSALYLGASMVLGLGFVAGAVRLMRRADRRSALVLYLFSLVYLALLFGAMVADARIQL